MSENHYTLELATTEDNNEIDLTVAILLKSQLPHNVAVEAEVIEDLTRTLHTNQKCIKHYVFKQVCDSKEEIFLTIEERKAILAELTRTAQEDGLYDIVPPEKIKRIPPPSPLPYNIERMRQHCLEQIYRELMVPRKLLD